MTTRALDLSLYLVTDDALAGERSLEDVVRQALRGGVTAVQLREKTAATRCFVERAQAIREITSDAGVSLIINDRVDVALAVDADGVHVGQHDMAPAIARRLIGSERILGVTASDQEQAHRAARDGASYIGCSAVFATPTKTNTGVPLGLTGLKELVSGTQLPVVAIGGIRSDNAGAVMQTGVAGVAVVSAIVAAPDPCAAAMELAQAVALARR